MERGVMICYFFQAPNGRPIQWPVWKSTDAYFQAIQQIFGMDQEKAAAILERSTLQSTAGARFFRMDNKAVGGRAN
jgi:hypothetical protein